MRLIDRIRRRLSEAQEMIYEAEFAASTGGVPVWSVLERVNRRVKNPLVARAVRKLQNGVPRHRAYEGILPKDVLVILRIAHEKQVEVGRILGVYLSLRKKIEEANRALRGAFMGPSVSYVIYSVLIIFGMRAAFEKFKGMQGVDIGNAEFIIDIFSMVFWIPVVLLWAGLLFIPHRIPYWKNVYSFVKAAQYLLITKIFYEIGLSAADAIEAFVSTGDKKVARRVRRLPQEERNIRGLSRVLSDYLDPVDSALLEMGVKMTREREVIDALVERKMVKLEKQKEAIKTFAEKLGLLVTGIPVAVGVVTFISLLSSVYGRL